ncbi:hypothetical protein C8Q80DRAFT_1280418 [Daedaleopsis nitida]|nr:hypothetical protein C8Q80DRAFT_1280418 [Daedaleopsis nitida]
MYSLDGQLIPTTPQMNDRYARHVLVTPEYTTIPRGLHTVLQEPPYLAPGWTCHINPEGSPFYVNFSKHLITDDPIQQEDIVNKITQWERRLETIIQADGMQLPNDYECYMTVDPRSDRCKYYFVDHTTQTVFWPEEIDPERHNIGISPVCSTAQMKYVLQEQYWLHQEYFPYRAVPNDLRKGLVDTFRQARAGQASTAVLWLLSSGTHVRQQITRHKYDTFFGEDYARISREQKRFEDSTITRTIVADKLRSGLLFNLPKGHLVKLDMLSSDNLTYMIHWREYAVVLLRQWRESTYLACGILIVGTISLTRALNPISSALGSISVVLALAGLVAGGTLCQWYDGAEKFTAAYVASHLGRVRSQKHGYEPIAQAFATPRALVMWSTIFLTLHVLSAVVDLLGLIVQAPAIVLGGIVFIALCHMQNSLRDGFSIEPPPQPLQW